MDFRSLDRNPYRQNISSKVFRSHHQKNEGLVFEPMETS
jgi:hypothetical protein